MVEVIMPDTTKLNAIVVDATEVCTGENSWSVICILYAQKRLFKAEGTMTKDIYIDGNTGEEKEYAIYSELEYKYIISEYCNITDIPEFQYL